MSPSPLLVIFDDARAAAWRPFTLTRPAGELRFGALLLRERMERVLGLDCAGYLVDPALSGYAEANAPRVVSLEDLPRYRDLLFLSSRVVPEWEGSFRWEEPGTVTVEGEPCGWLLSAGAPLPEPGDFAAPAAAAPAGAGPSLPLAGRILEGVWDLVAGTPDQVGRDVPRLGGRRLAAPPEGVHVVGDGAVAVGPGVEITPGVVLDATSGPIHLGDRVRVEPHSRIVGPTAVAADSTLLGGSYEAVSIGPVSKVHGDIEESVVLGWSNKAHGGYLGHAYLGAWVNVGAMTTNSDLKNNYGPVRMWTPAGMADTGLVKLGCLLGDHVKTAIGTMINTGTVIETGSNVFGGMPPKYVPPFSWGLEGEPYDVERFVETARVVQGRRGIELTESSEAMLRRAWSRGRPAAKKASAK